MTEISSISGTILHLQRLSTEDGPGIRTTVFFKGCPLRCKWCHNPESLLNIKQVQWIGNRCIACDSCLEACEQGGLTRGEGGLQRDRLVCTACGSCVEACPSGAMEMLGQEISVDDLIEDLVKDRAYFEKSGGGVTLSGGEPAFQPRFASALMNALKLEGIHVALDTCGLCPPEVMHELATLADLVLFDLKLLDSTEHKRWTGVENTRILENLNLLRGLVRNAGDTKALWIRTPLIPAATTGQVNIQAIGRFLGEHLNSSVTRWELCAFNNLCRDKYERLGMVWDFNETALMSALELEQIGEWARSSGMDPSKVFITGAAKLDN